MLVRRESLSYWKPTIPCGLATCVTRPAAAYPKVAYGVAPGPVERELQTTGALRASGRGNGRRGGVSSSCAHSVMQAVSGWVWRPAGDRSARAAPRVVRSVAPAPLWGDHPRPGP